MQTSLSRTARMKILTASFLALALATASGVATAQTVVPAPFDTRAGGQYDGRYDDGRYGDTRYGDGYYDYARVVRVVPVGGGHGYSGYSRECRSRDYADDGYYGSGGYYGGDRYGRDDYYGDRYGGRRGSSNGRAVASVVGSVLGALVGSQIGDGSGRIATSAIGSAVGAIAGQQVYENAQRQRNVGRVTVCDPLPGDYGSYRTGGSGQYDVTYEYGGRRHTTRTNYHPGDRIRVRVIAE